MKPDFFTKLIEEGTVKINVSRSVAIERLIEQSGICHEEDCVGNDLCFYCDKSGEFSVSEVYSRSNLSGPGIITLYGEITEDGDKSVAVYRIYKRNPSLLLEFFDILLLTVLLLICIVLEIFKNNIFSFKYILILLCVAAFFIAAYILMRKKKKYSSKDISVMKNEVFKRIDAVEKWDK